MTTTGYVSHTDYVKHTLEGHPENAQRIEAIWKVFDETGILNDLTSFDPIPATKEQIHRVHTKNLPDIIEQVSLSGGGYLDPDTYALPPSYEVALLSAGGVITAVDTVLKGEVDNALAVVRPPGHHATPSRAMGFCLFGNVGIAAQHALDAFDDVKRVMIVDYDVHHGNGTQDMFYDRSDVMYVSSHQYPYYPGSGAKHETGTGEGKGFTLNMPLSAGTGNDGFAHLYEHVLWPATKRYDPDLIIVSAGFDAHWVDPLASMQLDLEGYAHLTRELIRMAETLCDGKIVFALEGGYDLTALSHGMLNIAYALQGKDQISDPIGPIDYPSRSTEKLTQELIQIHELD